MTTVLRDGFSSFVPRARLIKLLGGELIRDEVMAVTELVKNAHDADAGLVRLTFRGTSNQDGELVIDDDGCGMSVETLLNHWMQPAGSSKSHRDAHFTSSGRRVLGEKGVGRFAIDRLGRHAEVISRARGSGSEIVATFDWDVFEDDSLLLSDVGIRWREQRAQCLKQAGTRIRITDLRAPWKERTFRRLCTRLQRLLRPGMGEAGFRIEIESDEFPDYQGLLSTSFFDRAPYQIMAQFDGEDCISCHVGNKPPVEHRWHGPGDLTCGPAQIRIHCFDLDSLAQIGPPQDIRAWLREWSGMSIYRDGFRVLPYGEPDDDWLRLDQRRVNNPVVRLSNNQVCGYVSIHRDANPQLRDQTNRGGLLQNRAYEDLRRLIVSVLQIIEAERQHFRNPSAEFSPAPSCGDQADTDVILSELRAAVTARTRPSGLPEMVDRLKQNLARERVAREQETESFVEMAAIGHGAGFAAHALSPRLLRLRKLIEAADGGQTHGRLPTTALYESIGILEELEQTAKFLGKIAPSRRGASRTTDVQAELRSFDESTASLLASHGASLKLALQPEMLIRAEIAPSDLHQVLHILLWNSLENISKRIEIKVSRTEHRGCHVLFRDTGNGIPVELSERIFEPGFSTKPKGRGMGLTVARRLLAGSGGTLVLKSRGQTTRWTTFELSLKMKRSRATPQ